MLLSGSSKPKIAAEAEHSRSPHLSTPGPGHRRRHISSGGIGRDKMFAARRFASRLFSSSALRRSDAAGGIPGENLPFDTRNRYKLTAIFTLFLGSGMALPFLVVRHHLTK